MDNWDNCEFQPNNIYNVDCYEAIKKIPDKSIDLVYIDVPYDLEDNGGGGCFGEKGRDYHKEYEKVSQNTNASRVYKSTTTINSIKEIAFGIDYSILDEIVRVCKNINCYIWCSKKQIYPLMEYFIGKHNCRFEIFTWHKTNPISTVNGKYLSDTEYCLLFRGNGTKIYDSDLDDKRKFYISSLNVEDKKLYGHPTIKPLNIVKKHIENSTKPNDIVLDTFLESGTTAVACKELGRRYIGFEIENEYYEIAKDRLNGISQQDKKLKEKGIELMSIFDLMEGEK